MSSAIRHEKKMQSLKYMNQNWITIPPITVRPFSSSMSRRTTPVISRTNSSHGTPPKNCRPFANSFATFTGEEMEILKTHDKLPSTGMKLTKSPSKLQQLQEEYQERENQKAQLKNKKLEQSAAAHPQKELERQDSFISIKFDEEDEFIRTESMENLLQSTSNLPQADGSGDVTIEDIKKNVWLYANSTINEEDNQKTTEIHAKFIKTDRGLVADIQPTPGIKQLRKTIAITSQQEDTLSGLTLEAVQTPQQKQEENKIRENLQDTLSAYRLRKYMDDLDIVPPQFLDEIDFTKSTKLNASTRKSKTSPIRKLSTSSPRRSKTLI